MLDAILSITSYGKNLQVMKKILFILTVLCAASVLCNCSRNTNDSKKDIEYVQSSNDPLDMVLLYTGGHHRQYFDEEKLRDLVVYTDRNGYKHWLFDGILLLEIFDLPADIYDMTSGTAFVAGYRNRNGDYLPCADKNDWKVLINNYSSVLGRLDKVIEEEISSLGNVSKRKIYVGIPEPAVHLNFGDENSSTKYWGEVNGKKLDFSNNKDRVTACKWFVDEVCSMFKKANLENIELVGFYWVDEDNSKTKDVILAMSDYTRSMGYGFNWIPYFNAQGYENWNEMGFSCAYYQPNYFFSEDIPYERLNQACKMAKESGLSMEIEFDENCCEDRGNRGYRLEDYMNVYSEEGIWAEKKLAYYQGSLGITTLKNSSNSKDVDLYHKFCEWVIGRPIRNK